MPTDADGPAADVAGGATGATAAGGFLEEKLLLGVSVVMGTIYYVIAFRGEVDQYPGRAATNLSGFSFMA